MSSANKSSEATTSVKHRKQGSESGSSCKKLKAIERSKPTERSEMKSDGLQIGSQSISILELQEFVDANGGIHEVDRGNAWTAIGHEMGIDTSKHPDVASMLREFFLLHSEKNEIPDTDEIHASAPETFNVQLTNNERKIQSGEAIEADLDLGDGFQCWLPGTVTRVRLEKGTFYAIFQREQDPVPSTLKFSLAGEGVEWRWPANSPRTVGKSLSVDSSHPLESSSKQYKEETPRQIRVDDTVEAMLDLGDGTLDWCRGRVTRVNDEKRSFRAFFDISDDCEAVELRFSWKKEGKDWRWPLVTVQPHGAAKQDLEDCKISKSGQSGRRRCDPYIGAKVKVRFEGDQYYYGKLANYDKASGIWRCVFDDGDEDEIRFPDSDVEVISTQKRGRKKAESIVPPIQAINDLFRVGCLVRVLFDDAHKYLGKVVKRDVSSQTIVVAFEDGEEHEIKLPDPDVEGVDLSNPMEMDSLTQQAAIQHGDKSGSFEPWWSGTPTLRYIEPGEIENFPAFPPNWKRLMIVPPKPKFTVANRKNRLQQNQPRRTGRRVAAKPSLCEHVIEQSKSSGHAQGMLHTRRGESQDYDGDHDLATCFQPSSRSDQGRVFQQDDDFLQDVESHEALGAVMRHPRATKKSKQDSKNSLKVRPGRKPLQRDDSQSSISKRTMQKEDSFSSFCSDGFGKSNSETRRDLRKDADRPKNQFASTSLPLSSSFATAPSSCAKVACHRELFELLLQEAPDEERLGQNDTTDFVDAMCVLLDARDQMNAKEFCLICGSSSYSDDMLFCRDCGDCFHPYCFDTRLRISAEKRHMWRCPVCRICENCHGEENWEHMLICDGCDRGFHMYCLEPPLDAVPEGGWRCNGCVVCLCCGARTPGPKHGDVWRKDCTLCNACGLLYEKGNYCPICKKVFRDSDNSTKMIQCDVCELWVHIQCGKMDIHSYNKLQNEDYPAWECPRCKGEIESDEEIVEKLPLPNPQQIVESQIELEAYCKSCLERLTACLNQEELFWQQSSKCVSCKDSNTCNPASSKKAVDVIEDVIMQAAENVPHPEARDSTNQELQGAADSDTPILMTGLVSQPPGSEMDAPPLICGSSACLEKLKDAVDASVSEGGNHCNSKCRVEELGISLSQEDASLARSLLAAVPCTTSVRLAGDSSADMPAPLLPPVVPEKDGLCKKDFQLLRKRLIRLQKKIELHQYLHVRPFMEDVLHVFSLPDNGPTSVVALLSSLRVNAYQVLGNASKDLESPTFTPKILLQKRTCATDTVQGPVCSDGISTGHIGPAGKLESKPTRKRPVVGRPPNRALNPGSINQPTALAEAASRCAIEVPISLPNTGEINRIPLVMPVQANAVHGAAVTNSSAAHTQYPRWPGHAQPFRGQFIRADLQGRPLFTSSHVPAGSASDAHAALRAHFQAIGHLPGSSSSGEQIPMLGSGIPFAVAGRGTQLLPHHLPTVANTKHVQFFFQPTKSANGQNLLASCRVPPSMLSPGASQPIMVSSMPSVLTRESLPAGGIVSATSIMGKSEDAMVYTPSTTAQLATSQVLLRTAADDAPGLPSPQAKVDQPTPQQPRNGSHSGAVGEKDIVANTVSNYSGALLTPSAELAQRTPPVQTGSSSAQPVILPCAPVACLPQLDGADADDGASIPVTTSKELNTPPVNSSASGAFVGGRPRQLSDTLPRSLLHPTSTSAAARLDTSTASKFVVMSPGCAPSPPAAPAGVLDGKAESLIGGDSGGGAGAMVRVHGSEGAKVSVMGGGSSSRVGSCSGGVGAETARSSSTSSRPPTTQVVELLLPASHPAKNTNVPTAAAAVGSAFHKSASQSVGIPMVAAAPVGVKTATPDGMAAIPLQAHQLPPHVVSGMVPPTQYLATWHPLPQWLAQSWYATGRVPTATTSQGFPSILGTGYPNQLGVWVGPAPGSYNMAGVTQVPVTQVPITQVPVTQAPANRKVRGPYLTAAKIAAASNTSGVAGPSRSVNQHPIQGPALAVPEVIVASQRQPSAPAIPVILPSSPLAPNVYGASAMATVADPALGTQSIAQPVRADDEDDEEADDTPAEPRDERLGSIKRLRIRLNIGNSRYTSQEFRFYIPHHIVQRVRADTDVGGGHVAGAASRRRGLERRRRAAARAQVLWAQCIVADADRTEANRAKQRLKRNLNRAVPGWDLKELNRLIEARAMHEGVLVVDPNGVLLLGPGASALPAGDGGTAGAGGGIERAASPGAAPTTWPFARASAPLAARRAANAAAVAMGFTGRERWMDQRECALCGVIGDRGALGRLLFVEEGVWAHVNCLCWSAGLYEDTRRRRLGKYGMLCGAHSAVRAARSTRCDYCGCAGASVRCDRAGCPAVMHFGCAVVSGAAFLRGNRAVCAGCRAADPRAEEDKGTAASGGGAAAAAAGVLAPAHLIKMGHRHLRVMPRSRPRAAGEAAAAGAKRKDHDDCDGPVRRLVVGLNPQGIS